MREIQINLEAIVSNYQKLREIAKPSKVLAVVKANAYGHGMLEVAKVLDQAKVDYLGVADLTEAMELRKAGITAPILAWIMQPDALIAEAIAMDIELGVSNFDVLNLALEASAKIHIKVDTGLGRGGFVQAQWKELFAQLAGKKLHGLFSHLANSSEAEDLKQRDLFELALASAEQQGIEIGLRHLAASAGMLSYPQMRYDLVRCGIALYGLNPDDRDMAPFGLTPAMKLVAKIVNSKAVPAGQTVSYNYRYRTPAAGNLALVPFGYAEGMPRSSQGHQVLIAGKRHPVVGQVAMDQFVVDTGADSYPVGTDVVIMGNPALGEPSAESLGASAGTINYEIVTRVGGRADRVYLRSNS